MCTSITLRSGDGSYLLARTMDFSFALDAQMVVFPRKSIIEFNSETLNDHYAFMGLAKNVGRYYIADGLNEYGLSAAALYFEGYASYSSDEVATSKQMLAPHEFIMWMLAKCKSVSEVIAEMDKILVVNEVMGFLGVVPPLHWVFLDTSGRSIVIEIMESGVFIHENELGILTNSPDYNWHITNVRSYIGLDPKQVSPRVLYGKEFKAFGQGSGTFGLPGDFTPPSRFIKTLYNKLSVNLPSDADSLVTTAMHVLNAVDIPEGSVVTPKLTIDYTQYTSYMGNSNLTYNYRMHDSLNVVSVKLSDYDLDAADLTVVE